VCAWVDRSIVIFGVREFIQLGTQRIKLVNNALKLLARQVVICQKAFNLAFTAFWLKAAPVARAAFPPEFFLRLEHVTLAHKLVDAQPDLFVDALQKFWVIGLLQRGASPPVWIGGEQGAQKALLLLLFEDDLRQSHSSQIITEA
jgi:hypothetical protein